MPINPELRTDLEQRFSSFFEQYALLSRDANTADVSSDLASIVEQWLTDIG
jgi:hypothetical protein